MADACECGNGPPVSVKCGNFLTSCKPVSFSRGTLHHGVSINILSFVIFKIIIIISSSSSSSSSSSVLYLSYITCYFNRLSAKESNEHLAK